jgi:MoxR-like ATPase
VTDHSDAMLQDWRTRALNLESQVNKIVIGQERVVRLMNTALFARGHVLLEGDVGVGKTTLLRAYSRAIGGAYSRIEGTIDLMPNDLVYYTYISEDGKPRVDPGPLLMHGEKLSTFFFNEINRARPQVHSLLLRVMAERSVTAFNREYHFPHLLVFADRNRVEKEETFEISSAARDRFMMEIFIETPADPAIQQALMFDPIYHDTDALVNRVTPSLLEFDKLEHIGAAIQLGIEASQTLCDYALNLWRATRKPAEFGVKFAGADINQLVLAGASPRGMSMLLRAARVAAWLDGRQYVVPEDIQAIFPQVIAHRIFFNPVYELRRAEVSRELIAGIMNNVAAP